LKPAIAVPSSPTVASFNPSSSEMVVETAIALMLASQEDPFNPSSSEMVVETALATTSV
jgi:hypothetical protein